MAISHHASAEAHKSVMEQGLRILHRTTIASPIKFSPPPGLPSIMDIYGTRPEIFKGGVWVNGYVGYQGIWNRDGSRKI